MTHFRSGEESINAYAALQAGQPLQAYRYVPKELGPNEVEIAVSHCGICHTDLHLTNNDFGISSYPLVPGHEIVGHVTQLGNQARTLAIGQRVGAGWWAGACFACNQCDSGYDNSCPKAQPACVGHEGGYATHVRVDERQFVLFYQPKIEPATSMKRAGGPSSSASAGSVRSTQSRGSWR